MGTRSLKKMRDIKGKVSHKGLKSVVYDSKVKDGISEIINNYKNMEEFIEAQLSLEAPKHHSTTGAYREEVWKSLFEKMIPRKYCIEQNVFIMDSYGRISAEVDLAVFDEMYTPYIFNYGRITFIPVEAVAAVVQCKSGTLKKGILKKWVDRIRDLQTSLDSAFRIISKVVDNSVYNDNRDKKSQTATRPLCILCTTAPEEEITEGICDLFDLTLYIEEKQLKKIVRKKWFPVLHEAANEAAEKEGAKASKLKNPPNDNAAGDDLMAWYQALNHSRLDRYGKNTHFYQKVQKQRKKFWRETWNSWKWTALAGRM